MDYIAHSRISCRKFGGDPSSPYDYSHYLPIHRFLDSSKLFVHNWRHRALLHNNWGVDLCIRMFGDFIVNPTGKHILVRDIAIAHIQEDCDGFLPSVKDWLSGPSGAMQRIVFSRTGPPQYDEEAQRFAAMTGDYKVLQYSDFFHYIVARLHPEVSLSFYPQLVPVRDRLKFIMRHGGNLWMNRPQKKELDWLKSQNFL